MSPNRYLNFKFNFNLPKQIQTLNIGYKSYCDSGGSKLAGALDDCARHDIFR